MHQGVLIEWTDTNPSNNTFEGTAREIFRMWLNTRSHQLGEVIFNPTARRGDADWRTLYIDVGDGALRRIEKPSTIRPNPQRLDTMVGKIRAHHSRPRASTRDTSTVSENGRYRIPNDNPFVKTPGARKEIWAYGLRNPHRLTFAVDPANAANNRLVASVCGLNTWEMIQIIHKGANNGFPLREGNEAVKLDNSTTALPADDRIPVMINDTQTAGMVAPIYPVIIWAHDDARRRLRRQRLSLQRQVRSRAARKVRLQRPHDRPHLVLRYTDMLKADDGNPQDDGEDVRSEVPVERSSRRAGCGQAGLRHDDAHRPEDVPPARREG